MSVMPEVGAGMGSEEERRDDRMACNDSEVQFASCGSQLAWGY